LEGIFQGLPDGIFWEPRYDDHNANNRPIGTKTMQKTFSATADLTRFINNALTQASARGALLSSAKLPAPTAKGRDTRQHVLIRGSNENQHFQKQRKMIMIF